MVNKELLKFCGNTKKYIVFAVFANLLRLVFGIGFAYTFAIIVNSILLKKQLNFPLIIIAMCIILLSKHILIRLISKYNFKIVREIKLNLREKIIEKTSSLGISYRQKIKSNELIHNAVEGVEQLENYFGGYLTQLYYSLFSTLILFLALFPFSKAAAFVLLFTSPLIPIFLFIILKLVKKSQKKYWKKYANVGNLFLDNLTGLTTLKIFGADKKAADKMDDYAEGFRKETMRILAMQLNSMTIIDWIAYLGAASSIIISFNSLKAGSGSVFSYLLVIFLAAEFFVPMKQLTGLFHVAMTGAAAGEEILNFLKTDGFQRTGSEEFIKDTYIELRNLDYAYKSSNWSLKNINIKIKNAELTAIVGPSGCGKSTIASLISGELYTDTGIFFNDISINDFKDESTKKNIVRVSHDGHVFSGTVRENLNIQEANINDDSMIKILKKLNLWNFLQENSGLDTHLMSFGKNISGGQAQRISLARALLYDASVYIFDEATSNIDLESEKIIIDTILELAKEKTVIYISHKLDTVKNADIIYVLNNGELVQKGKHDNLVKEDGLYQKLYHEQEELVNFKRKGIQ